MISISLVIVIFLLVALNAVQLWLSQKMISELTLKIMAGSPDKFVSITRSLATDDSAAARAKRIGEAHAPKEDELIDFSDLDPEEGMRILEGQPNGR